MGPEKVLSVIVAAYNIRPYLMQCLYSLAAVPMKEKMEVIVVDDGSTDGTGRLAAQFAGRHADVFRYCRKENGGHGSVVNTGIRQAEGQYFMVVDGDDWVDSHALCVLINSLASITADLAVCHYIRRENGKKKLVHSGAEIYGHVMDFDEIDIHRHYFALAGICYRTKLLRAGFQMPQKIYYDDLIYITEPVRKVKSIVFFDLAPYQYRIGHASQSISKRSMEKNYLHHRKAAIRLLKYEMHFRYESSRQMQYVRRGAVTALKDNYHILLQGQMNVRAARRKLKQLDAAVRLYDAGYLKTLDQEMKLFWIMRGSGYVFLRFYRLLVLIWRQIQKTMEKEGGCV